MDGVEIAAGFQFINVNEAWKGELNVPRSLQLSLSPFVTL